jgi:hypothetical protein
VSRPPDDFEPEAECEDCHWGLLRDEIWWTEHGYGPLCETCFMERQDREVPEEEGA